MTIRNNRLVVVDEVYHLGQLRTVLRLRKQNQKRRSRASNLNSVWFWPFLLAGLCYHYWTDCDRAKIGCHLSRHEIAHTSAAVTAQVTLTWSASRGSLDLALHLSRKLDRLTSESEKQWIPSCRCGHPENIRTHSYRRATSMGIRRRVKSRAF